MKKRYLAGGPLLFGLVVSLSSALCAHPIATRLAQRLGPSIVRAGDGKFSDPAVFLEHRFQEAAWLLGSAVVLSAVAFGLGTLLARRLPPLWQWIGFLMTGFVGLNLWLKLASGTCLFWCLFWNGKGTTDNLTQFHIKLLLMDENAARTKVVLAGSSQVRTQIDPQFLNHTLGSNIFTTELHFPGNRSFDFLFLNRELETHKADVIVCYVSEANFFVGGVSDGFPLFFTFGDLKEFFSLGGKVSWSPQGFGYGLLGKLLPLFWLRDPIAERVLGEPITGLRQSQRDASLGSDLSQRAAVAAKVYRIDEQSRFCFAAFDRFVSNCRRQHRRVVLCCGQVNPLLAHKLDPALRTQMLAFLQGLPARYENVNLLEDKDLPAQTETDYDDLMHANPAARKRFTEALKQVLERL